MTPRELRLRQRIDQLARERNAEREDAKRLRQHLQLITTDRLPHGCSYCGQGPAQGNPRTCWGHRDLPNLDPHYKLLTPTRACGQTTLDQPATLTA